jgi:hypothetical protein
VFGLATTPNLLPFFIKKNDFKECQPITSKIKQHGDIAASYFVLLFNVCGWRIGFCT